MNERHGTVADLKSQLRDHLQDDLAAVNAQLLDQLRSRSEVVVDIVEHVARFRGKQIRPVLLLLFNRMLNRSATDSARMLAAAVEMIHTATLVHDDVIDGADTRRHVATVHQRWNTETSVLLGDFLFSRAFHLSACTGDAIACQLIGRATDRTCEGELNQSVVRMNRSLGERDYFRIIRDKTGQLFALSCLLGARAADATSAQQRAAQRYGMRIGLAFQIADDILDLNAETASTGKDAANDLQNGRTTLPLLRALRLCPQDERDQLLQRLQQASGQDVAGLSGDPFIAAGIQSAAATAGELADRAIADLRCFPESADRQLLQAIAAFAVDRPS